MPIYDFQCPNCKITFEKIVNNNKEIIFCNCGTQAKIIFNPTSSFCLRGSGWGKDGYSKKKTILEKPAIY